MGIVQRSYDSNSEALPVDRDLALRLIGVAEERSKLEGSGAGEILRLSICRVNVPVDMVLENY